MMLVLVYHGLDPTIEDDWPTKITLLVKNKMTKKAYHSIILNLLDDALMAVSEFTNAFDLWKELKISYLVKDISSRLLSPHKLLDFKFATNKTIAKNLSTFKRLVQDFEWN